MGKSRSQTRAHCWWCGNPGVSNEDVVPLWQRRLYPDEAWWVHNTAHPDIGDYKTKRAKKPAFISRKFCQSCNNGWMSRLEQAASPLLGEMIGGTTTRLGREEQRLLAFWITKTTFTFQSLESSTYRCVPRRLYEELYRVRRPLSGTQIWLGWRRGGDPAWHRAHTLVRHNAPGEGFGSTLAMGSLVMHLIWHDDPKRALRLAGHVAGALIQIWPIRRARRWPTLVPLVDGDLSWLGKAVTAESRLTAA